MRSVVTRLKVRCNLTEESPALSYWLYRRPLYASVKPIRYINTIKKIEIITKNGLIGLVLR